MKPDIHLSKGIMLTKKFDLDFQLTV